MVSSHVDESLVPPDIVNPRKACPFIRFLGEAGGAGLAESKKGLSFYPFGMTLQHAGTTPLTTACGRDAQGRINSFSADGTVQATYTYEPGTGGLFDTVTYPGAGMMADNRRKACPFMAVLGIQNPRKACPFIRSTSCE